MNQIPIKLGPIALLLTVITICLTVMTILTFTTAGADKAMAQRYAQSTQVRYALEKQGQQFLQQADETLASGGALADIPDVTRTADGVEKALEQEGYTLKIRLAESGGSYEVTSWRLEKEWPQQETINNIWQP